MPSCASLSRALAAVTELNRYSHPATRVSDLLVGDRLVLTVGGVADLINLTKHVLAVGGIANLINRNKQVRDDDSMPARKHYGRDLPIWACEFKVFGLLFNDRPRPFRDLGR